MSQTTTVAEKLGKKPQYTQGPEISNLRAVTPDELADHQKFERQVNAICDRIIATDEPHQGRYNQYKDLILVAGAAKNAGWIYSKAFEAAAEVIVRNPHSQEAVYFAAVLNMSPRAPVSALAGLLLAAEINDGHLAMRKDALKSLGKIGWELLAAEQDEQSLTKSRQRDPLAITLLNRENVTRQVHTIQTLLIGTLRDVEAEHDVRLRAAALSGLGQMGGIFQAAPNQLAGEVVELAKQVLAEDKRENVLTATAKTLIELSKR